MGSRSGSENLDSVFVKNTLVFVAINIGKPRPPDHRLCKVIMYKTIEFRTRILFKLNLQNPSIASIPVTPLTSAVLCR